MEVINNLTKEKMNLEVGDIICFQKYGEVTYRLVCSGMFDGYKKYFTIKLEDGTKQLEKDSLQILLESYKTNFAFDLQIIKAKNIKLVIE